jgi:hypothetical protein
MKKLVLFLPVLTCLSVYTTVVYSNPSTSQQVKSPSQKQTEIKPSSISEVILMCRLIEESQNIPINCQEDDIEGNPILFISVPDKKTVEYYATDFDNYIILPFCNSANKVNRKAYIAFVIGSEEIANMYYCESDKLSGWFNIDELDEYASKEGIGIKQ